MDASSKSRTALDDVMNYDTSIPFQEDGSERCRFHRKGRPEERKRTFSETTRFSMFLTVVTVFLLATLALSSSNLSDGVSNSSSERGADHLGLPPRQTRKIHEGDIIPIPNLAEDSNRILFEDDRMTESRSSYKFYSCQDLYSVTPDAGEEQCLFAETCNGGDGVYLPFFFCSTSSASERARFWIISPLLWLWLCILFRLLASTADSYFSPALELCSSKQCLGLSPQLAGVTLLAPGNGAPDVSATISSITNDAVHGYELALGELTGGAMLVSCVVGGLVILKAHGGSGISCNWSLARDVMMLFIAIVAVASRMLSGTITANNVWLFLSLYAAYVAIVMVADLYQRKSIPKDETGQDPSAETSPLVSKSFTKPHSSYGAAKHESSDITSLESDDSSAGSSAEAFRAHHDHYPERCAGYDSDSESDLEHERSFSIRFDRQRHRYCGPAIHGSDSTRDAWEESKGEVWGDLVDLCAEIFVERETRWDERCSLFVELPFTVLRKLTVPIPCEEHYNRGLVAISTAISPIWVVYYLHNHQKINMASTSVFPFLVLFGITTSSVALLVFRFAPKEGRHMPMFVSSPLALYGFAIAATWIDTFANHLVDLLGFIGIVLRIPGPIMGLTVLAWGNSMGDMTSNISMAHRGLADIAITACYAGPVFNILIGLGLGFAKLNAASAGSSTPVELPISAGVGFSFLLLACAIILLVGVVAGEGRVVCKYGYIAISIYIIYMATSFVLEYAGISFLKE